MVARKKGAVVAAALSLILLLVLGFVAGSQVYAEESGAAGSDIQQGEDGQADTGSVALTEEEIPLAEAKASVLEPQSENKGMHSMLAFLVVFTAAGLTGGAVALRVKFGRRKNSYVHTDDLTIFRSKK